MTAEGRPERPAFIGPDWELDAEGRWSRLGARVVVIDELDRVLMLRAHDLGDPGRSWWFTVGGGIDVGEDARDAAVREAAEEVGLTLHRDALIGPVLLRSAVFDFALAHCRQDETFFLARVHGRLDVGSDRSAWTAIEHETVDEVRWLTVEEIATAPIQVYPEGLAELLPGWLAGWDGRVVEIRARD
ncbi:NUDIX hydrolase [Actinotalea sp.]|uniref:NUDIX hydrolase n=1 Tax=Actinotalea sp. TaxID=1872145 RepID=UPI003563A1EC